VDNNSLTTFIGKRISLPGHFDVPVVLEAARPLGGDDSSGYECRVRLPDGSLEEPLISAEEAASIIDAFSRTSESVTPADAEKLRLLIESARIRLAYAHDEQFAVSLSGIRTLPHQIEAVYQAMLPQPRLRFLLADDPGAGKTIMAGLPEPDFRKDGGQFVMTLRRDWLTTEVIVSLALNDRQQRALMHRKTVRRIGNTEYQTLLGWRNAQRTAILRTLLKKASSRRSEPLVRAQPMCYAKGPWNERKESGSYRARTDHPI
jgi:hypothetical protein